MGGCREHQQGRNPERDRGSRSRAAVAHQREAKNSQNHFRARASTTRSCTRGIANIVTGGRDRLVKVLAGHEDVDTLWVFGSKAASRMAERLLMTDRFGAATAEGPILLRHVVQMKNIWTPCRDWRHDRLNGRQIRAKSAG